MKNKKLLIGILSLCCTLSCAFGTACGMFGAQQSTESSSESSTESSVESSVESSTESSESSTESSESSEDFVLEEKAEVVLSEESLELEVYDKAALTATVYGSDDAVVWASSNPAVVTVDAEGNLLAVGEGNAEITATVEDVEAVCVVVVKAPTTAPYIKLASTQAYLTIGAEYVSEVKALWRDEEITESISYTWSVAEGEADDVVEIAPGKNQITLMGLKAGSTVLRVSTDIRGVHVSQDLAVTVYENDIAIVAENTAFIPEKGYYSLELNTVTYGDLYTEAEDLVFSVYENGVKVDDAQIEWASTNESVLVLEDNKIKAVAVGSGEFIGTCTVNEVTVNVVVRATVKKPVLVLDERVAAIEVENLTDVTLQSEILGAIEHAWLYGKDVLSSVSGTTLSFEKANLPTVASRLGEQTLRLETEKVYYDMPLTVYTMVINNKAEMDRFVSIAKANVPNDGGVWDGYFVLGNDIDYNGAFVPMTSHNQLYNVGGNVRVNRYNPAFVGFRGIFDGQGYNIDGLEIGVDSKAGDTAEAGIFGVIHREGIVRNISFTNAVARENAGYIAAAGGGLIENISITYKQIGGLGIVQTFNDGTQPRVMSSFYSTGQGISDTALVRNCFVDASQAKIVFDEKANNKYSWSSLQLAGKSSTLDNVIVICPNQRLLDESGSSMAYTSYQAFTQDVEAVAEFGEWNKDYWTSLNGIPFMVNLAQTIDKDGVIDFTLPELVFAGRMSYVDVIGAYTKMDFVGDHAGVTYNNGYLNVEASAEIGKEITLQLSSYLNDQVVEKSFTIKGLTNVTLEQAEPILVESTATELDISVGAEYNGETATVYVGNEIAGSGEIVDGKIAIDASMIAVNGYGETSVQVMSQKGDNYNIYDVKLFYVTKIITKAEELALVAVPEEVYDEKGVNHIAGYVIDGYYILGNDIDCTGVSTNAGRAYPHYEASVGFKGTFDGNGKTISNLTLTSDGLFGHVGEGAVIKDVTFDNVTYDGKVSTALFGFSVRKATIENVTVNVGAYGHYNNPNAHAPEEGLFSSRYFGENTVKNVTVHAEEFKLGGVFGRVLYDTNSFDNVVIYAAGYECIADNTDAATFTKITEFPEGIQFLVGLEIIVNNQDLAVSGDKYALRLATNTVAGSDAITEYALNLAVVYNGIAVENAAFEWTYDSEIVSVENNVIKSVGIGKTTVVGTYTHTNGDEETITIDVEVLKPILQVEVEQTETLYLESASTSLDLSVGEEYNGDTVSVYYNGVVFGSGELVDQKLTIDMASLGIQETNDIQTLEIEVITEKGDVNYSYMLTVSYVTKILTKASDFDAIRILTRGNADIYGYYLIANDIDFNGVTVTADYGDDWSGSTGGFRGTLEGNNYKISNFTAGDGGFFGQIGKGGVVRNIIFDQVTYASTNWKSVSLFGKSVREATLENITVNVVSYGIVNAPTATENYVDYWGGQMFVEMGLFASRFFRDNTITNVTINAQGFRLGRLLGRNSQGNTCTNVTIYGQDYVDIGCDNGIPETLHTELPTGITFIPDSTEA